MLKICTALGRLITILLSRPRGQWCTAAGPPFYCSLSRGFYSMPGDGVHNVLPVGGGLNVLPGGEDKLQAVSGLDNIYSGIRF